MRIVVGVSGASGSIYGLRMLQRLRARGGVETHLVLTRAGERTGYLELGMKSAEWRTLADQYLSCRRHRISLGERQLPDRWNGSRALLHTLLVGNRDGNHRKFIGPRRRCHSEGRRKLVLMVRESPFHLGHLRTMAAVAEMGAIIAPPVPAFYHKPQTVMEIVDHTVERVMDLLGVPAPDAKRWTGPEVQS